MSGFSLDFSEGGPYAQLGNPVSSLGFPDVLDFPKAYNLLSESPVHAPLLGIDGEGEPITVDLDSDSPHVLIVASTGGGKSVTVRSILAPSVAKGAIGVILDVKRISHKWAYGADNIGYAKTLPEIGKALTELGKEVHRRNRVIEMWDGPEETAPIGPRILVAFEETNATMTQLRQMDKRVPEGEYKAGEALNDILLLGRAANVHMVAVMQFPDFRVLPQAMVEQFATRIMMRYTKNAWVKIAWDAGLPLAAPSQPGRGRVVYAGKAREVQLLYLSEQECRQMIENYQRAVQGRSVRQIGRGHSEGTV